MHLDDYVTQVQQQLGAAAALGDEQVQRIAFTLSEAATSSVRLAILGAVSEAADEITALLLDFPLSPAVSVRLAGDELRTEVDASVHAAPDTPPVDDGEASARISLRLTEALKTQVEQAAVRDGVSVNTWIVRALGGAIADGGRRSA
ncbi:MAG TPA: toxin-antitoxin system HicB family antitoxin, partial [Jatrophihabitantaceae bacterium]|nr:toxin-antitoxin system HicB family antitoxin [Jatrophihabitantaceae bacterium]